MFDPFLLARRTGTRALIARLIMRVAARNIRFVGIVKGGNKMGWILIIVVGGILGWLASIVMRTDGQQGILLNIVVGIVGAIIGGLLLSPLIGGAPITSGAFDIRSLLVSFLGAVVLLAIINLFRRGSVR
jgi:uncharacterized membrane protein YeaQ/YmgE (transglycosylase-associated protein family)